MKDWHLQRGQMRGPRDRNADCAGRFAARWFAVIIASDRGRGDATRRWRTAACDASRRQSPRDRSAMKIYTKTGDAGDTGLFGGPRVRKDAPRIEAYGTVDELNSVLGVARRSSLAEDRRAGRADSKRAVSTWAAQLATPDPAAHGTPDRRRADRGAGSGHRPLRSRARAAQAVHPARRHAGGRQLHLARTVCRRAERRLVTLRAIRPNRSRRAGRLSESAERPAVRAGPRGQSPRRLTPTCPGRSRGERRAERIWPRDRGGLYVSAEVCAAGSR